MSVEYNEDLYDEFLYGGALSFIPPDVEPEDARAVVVDLYPNRVNWIPDPGFTGSIDSEGVGWKTISLETFDTDRLYDTSQTYDTAQIYDGLGGDPGESDQITVTTAPHTNYAVEIPPQSTLVYADYTDLGYVIPVTPPSGDDKPYSLYRRNLWKFAFSVRQAVEESTSPAPAPPTEVSGGFLVRRTDGSTQFVMTSATTVPLIPPWEDTGTGLSEDGWYTMYQVLDLGPDALWALPVLSNNHPTDSTVFTAVIAERWDDVSLLQGPAVFLDVGQVSEDEGGDARPLTTLKPWEYDWTRSDLLALDPLVYFDGDSSYSTQDDFVWVTPPGSPVAVSAYYPQRTQRAEGLRTMMRAWLAANRTASLRYTLDRPRVLRPTP